MAFAPATRRCANCDEDYQGEFCTTCGNGKKIDPAPVLKLVPRANMPNDKLVAMLERLLDSAKTGELEAVAVGCAWADGCTSYGWSTAASTNRVIASIARLEHAYLSENG